MRPTARSAFTLVEVILAILIISGIMTVLLYFYQRAAQVRQTALEEAEFLSIARMFMEQITTELRGARVVEDQFTGLEGSSNSLSFVCTSIPQTTRWILNTNDPIVLPPSTDLKRVSYRLLGGTNALEPAGVDRTETLLLNASYSTGTNATEFVTPGETNLVSELDTNLFATNQTQAVLQPLTDRIRYLAFRFWDGTNWVESWGGLDLPAGVEVTLGKERMPLDGSSETYPYEIFRRVIYLPNSTHPRNRVILEASPEEFAF